MKYVYLVRRELDESDMASVVDEDIVGIYSTFDLAKQTLTDVVKETCEDWETCTWWEWEEEDTQEAVQEVNSFRETENKPYYWYEGVAGIIRIELNK